jgi:hypothetical protein
MAAKAKITVEDLKDEITELKLLDIRKDISSLKDVICTELLEIKEHVKKTNGSVAKVTAEHMALRYDFDSHCNNNDVNKETLVKVEKETRVVRWLTTHPKTILAILAAVITPMGIDSIKDLIEWVMKLNIL